MTEDQFEIKHHHDPPRFLADENVRGLVRWLRFLGYDTTIAQGSDEVVRLETQRTGRCLVTRDSELASLLRNQAILVRSDIVEEQLRAVLKNAPATDAKSWFTRCVECNERLQELTPQDVQLDPQIPEALKTKPDLHAWHCPNCGHSYWKGSHVERMQGYFTEILQGVH